MINLTTSKTNETRLQTVASSDVLRIAAQRARRIVPWLASAMFVCALLIGTTVLSYCDDATSHQRLSDTGKEAIAQELKQAVIRGDTPGVVALVVGTDGVLYEGTAGKLGSGHDTPMPGNAIFLIASMTKPVTSVAAMQLVEGGKIKLDDPVSKYLPGFDNLQVITKFNETDASYETRPAKRPMTIRHLLTHTSGIGYGFSNAIVKRLTEATKKDEWQLPLLSDPGDQWNYGASTAVLGMIVEKVSGESLETYFQEHIFRPLGMKDTSYAVSLEKQSRVAAVHRRTDGRLEELVRHHAIPSTPTPPFLGDGGLYSTAQDYGTFMRMFLNGGKLGGRRILRQATVESMEQNNIGTVTVELQPGADPSISNSFPIGAGHDKFGLGFQIASGEARYAEYRSAGSVSWAGVYNSEFWIDPVKRIGGVMMMQVLPFYDDGAIHAFRSFERSVYQAINQAQHRDKAQITPGYFQQVVAGASETSAQPHMVLAGFKRPPAPKKSDVNPEWTTPVPPVRIADNLYYVGSRDLAAYLVTTASGLVLINANLDSSPAQIRKSAEKLGFSWSDVKVLLNSQAHYDHMGGAAEIVHETHAQNAVMDGDVSVVETGARTDFLAPSPNVPGYSPVHVDRVLHDGDTVSIGGVTLTAHKTAGHTRGCTTWTMRSHIPGEPADKLRNIVIVGGVGFWSEYHFVASSGHSVSYPGIAQDFRHTFATLHRLPCDVFLGAHGGYFDMLTKLEHYPHDGPRVFIDPAGYKEFVTDAQKTFEQALAKQRSTASR
jgi:metallo-beta-lactamase class B